MKTCPELFSPSALGHCVSTLSQLHLKPAALCVPGQDSTSWRESLIYPESFTEKQSGCATHDTAFPCGVFPLLSPRVTREHRESLAKLAKQSTNKSKEALRKVRSKSITQVKKFKNKVSEDTIWLLEKQIQQMADEAATEMDKLLAAKTKELLG